MNNLIQLQSDQDVMRCFSVNEWIRMCAYVDNTYGAKIKAQAIAGSGWNDNIMNVAGRSLEVRFRVLKITRTDTHFSVLLYFHDVRKRLWLNCTEIMDSKRKVA